MQIYPKQAADERKGRNRGRLNGKKIIYSNLHENDKRGHTSNTKRSGVNGYRSYGRVVPRLERQRRTLHPLRLYRAYV